MLLSVVSEKNNAEGSVFFSKVCNICNISVYFPFRRIIDNTVLLEEISLDFALFNNKLEVHIPGEIVLPIVKIVEDENELCFFFATLFTVHEFKLKHPNHNNEFVSNHHWSFIYLSWVYQYPCVQLIWVKSFSVYGLASYLFFLSMKNFIHFISRFRALRNMYDGTFWKIVPS